MNSVVVSIGKNLVLVALLILILVNSFMHWFGFKDLLWMQLLFGLVYIFLSYYEFSNTWFKAQLPKERFAYYPGSFFMSIAIKTGAYLMFGIVLMLSGSYMKNLYPICFIIALTKVVVCLLIIFKKLCFVSIYANYILIVREKIDRIQVNELENVEFRHEIVYFVKKDKSTYTVKTFSIENRKEFVTKILEWVTNNNLSITVESVEKMKEIIA